jgi:hypothetical protein
MTQTNIGDLDSGGVYVGRSATTGRDLHAALADEPEYLTFDEALQAAEEMRKLPGRENAHVPTQAELNENLYKNKHRGKLSGTFNTSGSFPGSCYRASEPTGGFEPGTLVLWFDDGAGGFKTQTAPLPVRLVW